jgi:hypothetical protein
MKILRTALSLIATGVMIVGIASVAGAVAYYPYYTAKRHSIHECSAGKMGNGQHKILNSRIL